MTPAVPKIALTDLRSPDEKQILSAKRILAHPASRHDHYFNRNGDSVPKGTIYS
jgi:hypothetical protein